MSSRRCLIRKGSNTDMYQNSHRRKDSISSTDLSHHRIRYLVLTTPFRIPILTCSRAISVTINFKVKISNGYQILCILFIRRNQ